jgi:glycosyltransferase involved in cell wall biosynthesis
MVSTIPPEGGGVSTYTKNLVQSFDFSNLDLTILANYSNKRSQSEHFSNKCIKIVDCWTEGLLYPFQIFKALCRNKPRVVHVQHEYFIFGTTFSSALFPLLAVFAKFLRVKFIVTLHGVVSLAEIRDPELSSIGNENLNGMPKWLSQMGMLFLTRLITDFSERIIVLNNAHRNVLTREYHCSPNKIIVVPHGVPKSEIIAQNVAKEKLGLNGQKVALYFGYITKYKGIDILVKAFKRIVDPRFVLIIGGALHPRLKNDPEYKRFWNSIMKEMETDKRIKFVGFIPDDILSTYISASDIVVFPYIASFSTGGPMNITLGHHKAVIASKISSFSDVLPASGVFKTGSVSDLSRVLSKTLSDAEFTSFLSASTKSVADERSWEKIAKATISLYQMVLNNEKS